MITQELALHEEPQWKYKPYKYDGYMGSGTGYQKWTAAEIRAAQQRMHAEGIKVGQCYRHSTSNTGYFITIMGVDNDPSASYYQQEPGVVLAKGNAKGSQEVNYTVSEIIQMVKIEENDDAKPIISGYC